MLDAVLALNGLDTRVFDSAIADAPPNNSDDYITVPDAHLLFNGEFKRVGSSGLKITGDDGKSFYIENYFSGGTHKHLLSPEGALLSAHVVEALAGPLAPGQFAQAGAQPAPQPVIGRVDAMSGSCTVVRNGVSVALNLGDTLRKGDVVQTSSASAISVVFTDGSTFSLSANARMVLDEFVYSAGGNNNSAVINLVQGTFSFVAGQVAKTGDMKVETPVATMGIRGTAVLVEISANDGQTKFSVMVEPNGITGSFNLYNKTTGALIGTVNNSQVGWVVTPAGPLQVVAQQVNKSPAELSQELGLVQQLFTIFNNYQQNPIDQQQQNPGQRGDNQNGPQTTGSVGSGGGAPTNGQQTSFTVTITQIDNSHSQTEIKSAVNSNSNSNSNTNPNSNNNTVPDSAHQPVVPLPTGTFNLINGTPDKDTLVATSGDDHIFGFADDDLIVVPATARGGNDSYDGGDGKNTLKFEGGTGVVFNLNVETRILVGGTPVKISTADSAAGGHAEFVNIAKVVGSTGNDVFILHDSADWEIDGGDGVDIVRIAGNLDLTSPSGGPYVYNIEILDLNQDFANFANFTPSDVWVALGLPDPTLGGSQQVSGHLNALRILGGSSDVITVTNTYQIGGTGSWHVGQWVHVGHFDDPTTDGNSGDPFNDHGSDGVAFEEYQFVGDNGQILATVYIQDGVQISVDAENSAPVIDLSPIVTRVSVPASLPPGTHSESDNAIAPAVSNDGRYVVFFSAADVPGINHADLDLHGDVFLYDRLTGTTTTLTDSAHIQNQLDGEVYSGFSILGDGSFAVFTGEHDVTDEFGTHNEARLYVYDRVHDQTRMLSDPVSHQPFSVDGLPRINSGFVTFSTQQYSTEGAFVGQHVLVTNLSGQIITDITPVQLGITASNVWIEEPDISGNGRYLTFWAAAHDTSPSGNGDYTGPATLYYYDRNTHTATPIATTDPTQNHEVWWASMSDDGRYVVFASNLPLVAGDTNGTSDIYLWDRDANGGQGALEGITLPAGAIGNGDSLRPSISSDGRFITFASTASNLVGIDGDANGQPDTFLYDRQTHTFSLISNASDGTPGDGESSYASDISSNGQIVVFSSDAANLVPGDTNGDADIFVVDRSGGTVSTVGEDASVSGGNTLDTHGSFRFSDADVADSHSVQVTNFQITGVPNGMTVPNGGFGIFHASVNENTSDDNPHGLIDWTFSVDNAQVQSLGAGQRITQIYTVRIADQNGGTVSQDVRITITGRNDSPVVVQGGTVTGSVSGGNQDLTGIAANYLTAGHDLINTLGGANGFGESSLGGNDDGSTDAVSITSVFGAGGLNFFGQHYTSIYINNNGNITFVGPSGTFTPSQIGSSGNPIIAPFWADVDTRGGSANATAGGNSTGSDLVYYDLDTTNHVLTVTWDDVGYFASHTTLQNAFQLQLIDRGNGDFDIVFRYEDINWTTGDASGGSGGLGGAPARAGYSAGDGNMAHYFELPGSGDQNTMLGLEGANGNTGIPGVYVFHVRSGNVSQGEAAGTINFSDPDVSDHHTVSSSFNPGASGHQNALGVLTATVTQDTTGGTGGVVTWEYNIAPEVLSGLAPGSTVTEVFNVAISDGNGGIITQPVTVTVNGPAAQPNVAPVAHDDTITPADGVTFSEDTQTQIAASLLLTNDTDSDHDTLTVTGLGAGISQTFATTAHGSVTLNGGVITYMPVADYNGSDSFTYWITDGHGHSSSAIASFNVAAVNDRPVLNENASPALDPVDPGAGAPVGAVGTLVSQLVSFASDASGPRNVTDVDGDGKTGIAIYGNHSDHGDLYYSIDDGATWNLVGSVDDQHALLLAADSQTRLYFQPAADFSGTIDHLITFRAWDQTEGSNGQRFDLGPLGTLTTTSVSGAPDDAGIVVVSSDANHAPEIHLDAASTTGNGTDTTLVGLYVTDSDPNELFSVTVVTQHGSVAMADQELNGFDENPGEQGITFTDVSLGQINAALTQGVVYTNPQNPTPGLDDKVTVTITDHAGASDTVNFIFNVSGDSSLTLTGSDQKDVLFNTGYNDTLTGGGGNDTFVFGNQGENGNGHDNITDFVQGQDKIALYGIYADFPAMVDAGAFDAANNRINLGGDNWVALTNGVHVDALTANDFIFHYNNNIIGA
jgi:VCBS repeat-containing protein